MSDVRDDKRSYYRSQAASAIKRIVKRFSFEGAPAQATLSTALTGSNNDLDFEAQDYGAAGNDISIEYRAPTAPGQDTTVEVDGNAIVVNLGSGNGTNEVQLVTVVAAGGTFILGFRDQYTQPIAYNATTATVQERLRALPGLSGVTVGGSAGAWQVTFAGEVAGSNVAQLTIDGNRLLPHNPGAIITEFVKGDDSPATNEVQKVTLVNAAAGTFTLTYSGQTTAAIAYNASAATVKSALEALSNIAVDDITVTKAANGTYTITFINNLAATDVDLLTADVSGLRVASVSTTTPGVAYAIDATADDVVAAIEGDEDAAALVNVTNKSANDGSGVVTAMAETNLAGGKDGVGSVSDAAAVTIDPTGNNNALVWTAKEAGLNGNGIRIEYVDPGANNATESIDYDADERIVTVNLATDGSGVITSTGDTIKTTVGATPEVDALFTVTDAGGNDGSGVVTAVSVVETSGGGGETTNGLAVAVAHGDVEVAAVLQCSETIAGATGTLKLGTSTDDDNLMPSITGTNLTAGKSADKSGVVATLTAPNETPHQLISDGQTVYLKPGTADLTDGTVDVVLYYRAVSDGGRLVVAD